MNTIVNGKKKRHHKETIDNFSDENRMMFGGVARGFSKSPYSWTSDLLFKHKTNFSTNKNIASVSFFSERETVYNDYGCLPDIYSIYDFLQNHDRQKVSANTYELMSRQYRKIGQKHSEYDLIEYINKNVLESKNWKTYSGDVLDTSTADIGTVIVNHDFRDSPVYYATGYRIDGYGDDNEYSKRIWTKSSKADLEYETHLKFNNFEIDLGDAGVDIGTVLPDSAYLLISRMLDNAPEYQYGTNGNEHESVYRLFNHKIQIDHEEYFYFEDQIEWVVYYNTKQNFVGGQFNPFFGGVKCYEEDGTEIVSSDIKFYPEIIDNGILEPAKVIVTWSEKKTGKVSFNTANVTNTGDDQSRLVFSISKSMLSDDANEEIDISSEKTTYPSIPDMYKVKRKVGSEVIYEGIDFETERNRRASSIVMTEPFFTTSPIMNNSSVQYKMINENGEPINYDDPDEYHAAPGIFLKIKGSLGYIREIDRLLSLNEQNSDIINSLVIEAPRDIADSHTGYYDSFFNDDSTFFDRQNDTLTDLHGGKRGDGGQRYLFSINAFGTNRDEYSDTMKVEGVGYFTETVVNLSGAITGIKEYTRIYLSNHSPETFTQSILLDDVDLQANFNIIMETGERFRPMLKLDSINGYIKLVQKNRHFKVLQTSDGMYEAVYNIEFPYAPGSYDARLAMDFSDDEYFVGQILYKKAYINAGSEKVNATANYELANDRYIFTKDQAFTYNSLSSSGSDLPLKAKSALTGRRAKGGGGTTLKKYERFIRYPTSKALSKRLYELLYIDTVTDTDEAMGVQVFIGDPTALTETDYKLFFYADNQKWQYNSDHYESHIGRENPSYVFEMDIDTAINASAELQKKYACIPDIKRWIWAHFKGSGYVVDKSSNLISSRSSGSSIVVDIWDEQAIVGSSGWIYADSFIEDSFIDGDNDAWWDSNYLPGTGGAGGTNYLTETFTGSNEWYVISGDLGDDTSDPEIEPPNGNNTEYQVTPTGSNISGDFEIETDIFIGSDTSTNSANAHTYLYFNDGVNDKRMVDFWFADGNIRLGFCKHPDPKYVATVFQWTDEDTNGGPDPLINTFDNILGRAYDENDILHVKIKRENTALSPKLSVYYRINQSNWILGGTLEGTSAKYYHKVDWTDDLGPVSAGPATETDIIVGSSGTELYETDIPGWAGGKLDEDVWIVTVDGDKFGHMEWRMQGEAGVFPNDSDGALNFISSIRGGSWRPFSVANYDSDKVRTNLLVDSMVLSTADGADVPTGREGLKYVTLRRWSITGQAPITIFPTELNLASLDESINKVLYNADTDKCYHVARIQHVPTVDPTLAYEELVLTVETNDTLPIAPSSGDSGPLELYDVDNYINRNHEYEVSSSRAVVETDCRMVKKFIDIRKPGDYSDLDRYVSANNKVFFRVRVLKNAQFPVSKTTNKDIDKLQHIGPTTDHSENPWSETTGSVNEGAFDKGFDHTKVSYQEKLDKLALNYFRLASK